jgi:hypothetical protein
MHAASQHIETFMHTTYNQSGGIKLPASVAWAWMNGCLRQRDANSLDWHGTMLYSGVVVVVEVDVMIERTMAEIVGLSRSATKCLAHSLSNHNVLCDIKTSALQ